MDKENLHIIPHQHFIKREDREKLNGHKGLVLWFTGLSGSGKSTVAGLLERELHARGKSTYILDGDNIRSGLNADLDFSEKSRTENIRRIGEVAKLFTDSGIITLSAFISPFKSDREKVKNTVGAESYIEIFVDCPLEVCEKRDVKGLYAKARAGEIPNFTGISSPFESPENPEIRIETHKNEPEECVKQIINIIESKLKL